MDQMLTGAGAFDPSKVVLLLGGWEVYGFAEGTKIVINKTSDLVIPYVGTDGDVSLALQRNKIGTMTISLQNTSGANEVLTAYNQQMLLTGEVAFPVYMNDPKGFQIMATIGWLQTQPDMTIGSEIESVDWVIGLKDANLSYAPASGILSALNGVNALSGITGITV